MVSLSEKSKISRLGSITEGLGEQRIFQLILDFLLHYLIS